jgi:hypothetical protein
MKHFAEKALAIFLSMTLSAAAAGAASKHPPRTQYMAVMMAGKKVGHSVATFKIHEGKALTHVKMSITVARGRIEITIGTDAMEIETPDGKPLGFSLKIDRGFLGKSVTYGAIGNDGKLNIVKNVGGGAPEKETRPWPKGALMSHGRMLRERKAGLKPATKITTTVFDPATLAAMTVTSTVGKKSKVDLLGRVVMLTEVKSIMQSMGGRITTTTYVNDDHIPLKSVTPAMGMRIVLIDCSKAVAMASNETLDLISKVILASPVALTKGALGGPLVYTIKPSTPQANPQFLDGDNQSVRTAGNKTTTLTIRPTPAPRNAPLPYSGRNPAALEALKPSSYVQSDHKTIKALAKKAVGNAGDAATAVARIEKFVRQYITTKNLSVGYATAVEVAQSREGDCTEHAVLTASLCRASGIPARVVVGVAYVDQFAEHRNVFGPHAWNRAFVGGKWVGLDSALEGFNTGHIALAHGDGISDAMLKVASTIGNFKIVSIKSTKANK